MNSITQDQNRKTFDEFETLGGAFAVPPLKESVNVLKTIISNKLNRLILESDFESWFNRSAAEIGGRIKRGDHIDPYEASGQRGESPDTRMKHPDSPGYGYLGGKAGKFGPSLTPAMMSRGASYNPQDALTVLPPLKKGLQRTFMVHFHTPARSTGGKGHSSFHYHDGPDYDSAVEMAKRVHETLHDRTTSPKGNADDFHVSMSYVDYNPGYMAAHTDHDLMSKEQKTAHVMWHLKGHANPVPPDYDTIYKGAPEGKDLWN